MKLENLKIKGLKLINSKIYRDKRGFLREVYKNKLLNDSFLFDVMSYSKKNVLRGLHIQTQNSPAWFFVFVQRMHCKLQVLKIQT